MSEKRSPGRPTKKHSPLSRADVLSRALELLDTVGERRLTMRALAKGMSVTPMALYHHVGNRDELVVALVEHVFGRLNTRIPSDLDAPAKIETLLSEYYTLGAEHPELLLIVFRDQAAFARPLREITEALRSNLRKMGLNASDAERWLGILIDYTHGYALSQVSRTEGATTKRPPEAYIRNIRLFIGLATETAPS